MASQAVVDLVVNAADADRQLPRQIRRIADEAERRAPTVDLRVDVDTRRLENQVERSANFLNRRLNANFGATVDSLDRNFAQLGDRLSNELQQIAAQSAVANAAIGRLDNRLEELGRTARHTGDDLDHASDGVRRSGRDGDEANDRLGRLTGILGGVGRASLGLTTTALRITSLASVASTAVPLVAGLVSEITNMAPAAAIGVSALVTYAGAIGTLKLATSGVGDVISEIFKLNSDPKKVAEALKNLSPNAQAFVKELQSMKSGFDALRLDVQDRFFKGLNTTLAQTGKAVFPSVQKATRGFADTFNRMAKGVGASAQALGRDGTLGKALDGSVKAFGNLERIPGQVLNAVFKLAAGGSPALGRLTDKLGGFADRFTEQLDKAAKSGALEKSIDKAVATIAQLGRVVGNVFGIIGNVLGAATTQGAGLFGTLEKVTAALEAGTATPLFQKTLQSLISLGNTIVTTVLPLLGAAFAALAPVIQTLVPPLQEVVTMIGGKLAELIPALQEPLTLLASNIGLLLDALSPLISEGIDVLIRTMPSLVALFTSVSQIIIELTPTIAALAPLLGDVLVVAINILVGAVAFLNSTLATVIDFTKRVVAVLVDLTVTLVETVVKAVQLVAAVFSGDWSTAWNLAKSIVSGALSFAYNAVTTFLSGVVAAIGRLVALLPAGAQQAFNGLVTAAREKGAEAVAWMRRTGSNLIAAVTGYGARFYSAGRALIGSFVDGIKSMISSAVSAAKSVISSVADFLPHSPAKKGPLSGRGYPLYSGMAFTQSFARGIRLAAPALDKAVGGLLNRSLTATSGPSLGLAQVNGPGAGSGSGLLSAPAPRILAQVAAPVVNVHIGIDRLRGYMQQVVDDNNRTRDRLAAQGTGR